MITSDRGMNGAYSANAIKTAARLTERLRQDGVEVVRYAVGRKGITYLKFRGIDVRQTWEDSRTPRATSTPSRSRTC